LHPCGCCRRTFTHALPPKSSLDETVSSHEALACPLLAAALALGSRALAADAATNWADQCAKCHGADGKGETKMGKKLGIRDLSDAAVQAGFADDAIVKAVKEGIKDKEGKVTMKPIEGLADAEISALIPVVRSLKK
jgi:cytochrome c553